MTIIAKISENIEHIYVNLCELDLYNNCLIDLPKNIGKLEVTKIVLKQ